jgi:hypothetical protein
MKPLAAIVLGVLWLWWAAPTYEEFYGWRFGVEIAALLVGLALIVGGMIAAERKFWEARRSRQ